MGLERIPVFADPTLQLIVYLQIFRDFRQTLACSSPEADVAAPLPNPEIGF